MRKSGVTGREKVKYDTREGEEERQWERGEVQWRDVKEVVELVEGATKGKSEGVDAVRSREEGCGGGQTGREM